jgi:hypothetical protein
MGYCGQRVEPNHSSSPESGNLSRTKTGYGCTFVTGESLRFQNTE